MTPMMLQYFEVKNQYRDYILLYRLGDFYEMFYDDAKIVSRELDLTLTGRDCGEPERAPMCGVPYHAVEVYIGKLVAKGFKIAICEQMEDPATAKGIVKREITRIITPGTVVESNLLSESRNNYLSAVCAEGDSVGIAFADISTGQISATKFSGERRFDRLINELATYQPSEVITNTPKENLGAAGGYLKEKLGSALEENLTCYFDPRACDENVRECFGDKYTPDFENVTVTRSIGALISYIRETQKTDLSYLTDLSIYTDGQYLEMDVNTRRNLELTETMRQKEKKGSLLWVLDRTKTSMGARMLRKWVELPLVNTYYIGRRLQAVKELSGDFMLREELSEQLKNVLDLERLTTKLVYGTANGKDLNAIKNTIGVIPAVRSLLENCESEELHEIYANLDELSDLFDLISESIADDPPFSIREGGFIRDGYSDEVDYLRSIMKNSTDIIHAIEAREKEATGIKTLKIGYNRVFGYYIEVSNSQKDLVPAHYIRKQTLVNGERFITEELKDTESTILGAADKDNSLEYEMFRQICKILQDNIVRIQNSASLLARLDVYLSLADVAVRNHYVYPEVDYSDEIIIKDGRHPVVEKFVEDSYFVPNDTSINTRNERLMLITGPNMAGKSTYMRQVALITLMAQIGSFVPAREARIGICDKIFTRVGASDDLASGQSTFMLEMNEVAYILKNATKKSLVIYDEIGRGTSTYDGMSIARAIAEFTASPKLSCRTLFATHYHELTDLENKVEGIVNYNIAAKKRGDDITFLRKIIRGAADDSYGIEVAKLAGVPAEIIKNAKGILKQVEAGTLGQVPERKEEPEEESPEMTFESVLNTQLADAVRAVDINTLTPIEAMNALYQLKKMIE